VCVHVRARTCCKTVLSSRLQLLRHLPPLSRAFVQVTCGSADRMVYVWDTASRRMLYKLPGHSGSVNEAVFHPSEPILGSGSSDRQIFLGELAV
jgi:WD40 repeat protein